MLYYAAAFFRPSGKDRSAEMGMRYRDLKYNIMRIPFDAETMTFGSPDTVYNAAMLRGGVLRFRVCLPMATTYYLQKPITALFIFGTKVPIFI